MYARKNFKSIRYAIEVILLMSRIMKTIGGAGIRVLGGRVLSPSKFWPKGDYYVVREQTNENHNLNNQL